MALLLNRACANTATPGTGTITLGAAATAPAGEADYQSWASAGAVNAQTYAYLIQDGDDWELGTGIYTSSGTTLTRNVTQSMVAGVAGTSTLNLSGSATVACVMRAEDQNRVLIERKTANGSTGSYTFSDIPQDFTDLELRIFGRCSNAVSQAIAITLNAIATGYDQQRQYATATTNTADSVLNGSSWGFFTLPGTGVTAGWPGAGRLDIFGYSQTTLHKACLAHARHPISTTTGSGYVLHAGGVLRSAAAITSLTAALAAGNYETGSYLALYGIR